MSSRDCCEPIQRVLRGSAADWPCASGPAGLLGQSRLGKPPGNTAGLEPGTVTVVRVPGAFEIPAAAKAVAHTGKVDAVIALGTIIRGETSHFEYIASECARGVAAVTLETGIPVIFGVLTVDDSRHALERSGEGEDNKGREAARAALEMISVLRRIRV